jgi:hypothetical protein
VDISSTEIQPPDFGPTQPVYPELPEVVRVSGPSIGSNVYPAFLSQWTPPLVLRDRVPVYAWEPNGIVLGPGYYDCRLVGSYLNLPLYAVTCCPTGPFSSSSKSSGS